MRKRIETEMDSAKAEIERLLLPQGKDVVRHLSLPRKGQTLEWILDSMEQMDEEAPSHADYRDGKLSGAVYRTHTPFLSLLNYRSAPSSVDGGDDMERVLVAAFQRYCVSNPLHPDVFPAIRKMEAEIVAMCLRMYNNPTGAGATTSGGTESILMSVKTHRDWARAVKGICEPEMYALARSPPSYTLKRLVGRPQGRPCVGSRRV
jgi:sphinganine-1-phosphate aldolase